MLCDSMDFSMPGFPVLYYLPEFAQKLFTKPLIFFRFYQFFYQHSFLFYDKIHHVIFIFHVSLVCSDLWQFLCLPCFSWSDTLKTTGSIFHSSVQFSRSGQASLSITNSQSLWKLIPIELVMPSNHLILCHPLLLLSSIFPSMKSYSEAFGTHSSLWVLEGLELNYEIWNQ